MSAPNEPAAFEALKASKARMKRSRHGYLNKTVPKPFTLSRRRYEVQSMSVFEAKGRRRSDMDSAGRMLKGGYRWGCLPLQLQKDNRTKEGRTCKKLSLLIVSTL